MDKRSQKVVVCGAGGFIGGHLIRCLVEQGIGVIRAVDVKPLKDWYQVDGRVENLVLDLKQLRYCQRAVAGMTSVYQLAADMGGMGFIENNKARCMLSSLINTHMLMAAKEAGIRRFFYSSSACVYNAQKQSSPNVIPLKESDAHPAQPEEGYGWEKLFSEQLCLQYDRGQGLPCRIARYHNVYGPYGTWRGGREKAPAAICRKVLEAKYKRSKEIEIWGDGTQTRSFMYIDDCIKGTQLLFGSDFNQPLNIGSSELVSINGLVDIVEEIAGLKLKRRYDLMAPKGVNGRNSDNTLILHTLNWEPSIKLREGLAKTYAWIEGEMLAHSLIAARRSRSVPRADGLRIGEVAKVGVTAPTLPEPAHLVTRRAIANASGSFTPSPE